MSNPKARHSDESMLMEAPKFAGSNAIGGSASAKRGNRVIRPREVAQRLGISRSKLYELINTDESFPPRKKISPRIVGWLETDIDTYIVSLPDK
jgi:predicted DNA-binding transcriptional regulator AlpA